MAMTTYDFEGIAEVIKRHMESESVIDAETMCVRIAAGIADHCEQENQRFDRNRFYRHCGFDERLRERFGL